jgi:hypothetical protein
MVRELVTVRGGVGTYLTPLEAEAQLFLGNRRDRGTVVCKKWANTGEQSLAGMHRERVPT